MSIRDVDYDEATDRLWQAVAGRASYRDADIISSRATMVYLALASTSLDFYDDKLPRLVALLDAMRELL